MLSPWHDHGRSKHGNLIQISDCIKDKLKSKGVDSVKSRVTNLRDYLPELTMEELKVALKQSFEKVYGLKVRDKK